MTQIWHFLSKAIQEKLRRYQQKHYGEKLQPPLSQAKDITTDCKIENSEELEIILRQKPKHRG